MATRSVARPSKSSKPPPIPTPPTLTRLTSQEAGELLGVSRKTVYAMAKEGKLPAMPVGVKAWRFYREPLLLWQQEQLRRGLEGTP